MQLRTQKDVISLQQMNNLDVEFMESDEKLHLKVTEEFLLEHLEKGIHTLNDEQKECIQLFYIQQYSYLQIVEKTGYEIKKVKSYLQNGKRNLLLYFKRNGLISWFLFVITLFFYN